MKKTIFSVAALMFVIPLFAQGPTWDLSPIQSSLRTLVPAVLGIVSLVALLGWMTWNLFNNWEKKSEIFVNAGMAVIALALVCGIVYAGMRMLLQ